MSFTTWLRNVYAILGTSSQGKFKATPRARLSMERLEDRTVLSAGTFLQDPDPGQWGKGYGASVAGSDQYVLVGKQPWLSASGWEANEPGGAYLYEAATGELLHSFSDPVLEAKFGFGGTVAVSNQYSVVKAPGISSGGGAVYVFDNDTGSLLHTLTDCNLPWAVAVSDRYVAVSSINSQGGVLLAFVYDAASGALLHTLNLPNQGYSIALAGDRVFVGSAHLGSVYEFDAVSGALSRTFAASSYSLAVSGDTLLVGGYQGARQFDVNSGNLVRSLVDPSANFWSSFGNSVAIAGNDLLVANSGDHVIHRFSGVNGDLLQTYLDPTPYGGFGWSIAVSGATLASNDVLGSTLPGVQLIRPMPDLALDLEPNNVHNVVNLNSSGFLTMAILSTEHFDALDVDLSTLQLNWFTSVTPARVVAKDVDHDGDLDLLISFDMEVAATAIGNPDTELTLSGTTLDGIGFYCSDSILVRH